MKRMIMIFILLLFVVGCSSAPVKPDYKAVQFKMIDYETAKAKYELNIHKNETVEELLIEQKYGDELIAASKALIKEIEDFDKAVKE